jgi:hypothetical protein
MVNTAPVKVIRLDYINRTSTTHTNHHQHSSSMLQSNHGHLWWICFYPGDVHMDHPLTQ